MMASRSIQYSQPCLMESGSSVHAHVAEANFPGWRPGKSSRPRQTPSPPPPARGGGGLKGSFFCGLLYLCSSPPCLPQSQPDQRTPCAASAEVRACPASQPSPSLCLSFLHQFWLCPLHASVLLPTNTFPLGFLLVDPGQVGSWPDLPPKKMANKITFFPPKN